MHIAKEERVTSSYVTRVMYLAFLAPDIVERILRGDYPSRDEKAAHEYRCLAASVFGWPYSEVSGETTEG
jgi:hypothetical protein